MYASEVNPHLRIPMLSHLYLTSFDAKQTAKNINTSFQLSNFQGWSSQPTCLAQVPPLFFILMILSREEL